MLVCGWPASVGSDDYHPRLALAPLQVCGDGSRTCSAYMAMRQRAPAPRRLAKEARGQPMLAR